MQPDLFELFISELKDMYSAEHQIVQALPDLIRLASLADLKEALITHLKETNNQVNRLEKIFSILSFTPQENRCEAMAGLLKETETLTGNKEKSPILDAAIISMAQKVEHYEIASYGTLRSFANHLDLDSDIINLLQESLDEEATADKKLSKIADGSLFTTGVNKKAAELTGGHRRK